MSSGWAAVVTSTDKSMPAAPASSGGCGCSDADAPQLSLMLDLPSSHGGRLAWRFIDDEQLTNLGNHQLHVSFETILEIVAHIYLHRA
jgi:hypothetical protein